jgi:glycosyltransferase involved in cell wall biosynthesis
MSACAVMLVKDELDIIAPVVRHLLAQVDQVIVSDNASSDGTRERLGELAARNDRLTVLDDTETGYYQARKTTALALLAARGGHEWVIPCDADEWWYAPDGRRLADFLAGVPPDTVRVRAPLYNHIPTGLDRTQIADPLARIGWRFRNHQPLKFGKVACRLLPGLEIEMGNHAAAVPGIGTELVDLCIRHFSWRTAAQYLRKIRNGEKAYAATDLPEGYGSHWRGFAGAPDAAVTEHFYRWFYVGDPNSRDDLIYDPVVGS